MCKHKCAKCNEEFDSLSQNCVKVSSPDLVFVRNAESTVGKTNCQGCVLNAK